MRNVPFFILKSCTGPAKITIGLPTKTELPNVLHKGNLHIPLETHSSVVELIGNQMIEVLFKISPP